MGKGPVMVLAPRLPLVCDVGSRLQSPAPLSLCPPSPEKTLGTWLPHHRLIPHEEENEQRLRWEPQVRREALPAGTSGQQARDPLLSTAACPRAPGPAAHKVSKPQLEAMAGLGPAHSQARTPFVCAPSSTKNTGWSS